MMVRTENLTKHFGGIHAVDGVSLTLHRGAVTGLIGPNGAGKSTLFNVVAGALRPSSGRVILDGEDVTGLPPHELFGRGLLRTFQLAQEFATLSVRENLMVVPRRRIGEAIWSSWLRPGAVRAEEERAAERADEVMAFLALSTVADLPAGALSGGQKKLLELGRTLMADPKIVFLDEVGAGVNRTLLAEIGDAIVRLNRERGITFCLIEHDMDFVERLCDPVIVMAEGKVLAEGDVETLKSDERVIEAYLGRGRRKAA